MKPELPTYEPRPDLRGPALQFRAHDFDPTYLAELGALAGALRAHPKVKSVDLTTGAGPNQLSFVMASTGAREGVKDQQWVLLLPDSVVTSGTAWFEYNFRRAD